MSRLVWQQNRLTISKCSSKPEEPSICHLHMPIHPARGYSYFKNGYELPHRIQYRVLHSRVPYRSRHQVPGPFWSGERGITLTLTLTSSPNTGTKSFLEWGERLRQEREAREANAKTADPK